MYVLLACSGRARLPYISLFCSLCGRKQKNITNLLLHCLNNNHLRLSCINILFFFVFLLKGNNLSSIHSRIKKQKKLKTRKLRKINSKTTRLTSLLLVGDIELSPVSYSLLSLLLSVFFLLTASFN